MSAPVDTPWWEDSLWKGAPDTAVCVWADGRTHVIGEVWRIRDGARTWYAGRVLGKNGRPDVGLILRAANSSAAIEYVDGFISGFERGILAASPGPLTVRA